jgi:membrane protein YdbS with pleckstrin-like domain
MSSDTERRARNKTILIIVGATLGCILIVVTSILTDGAVALVILGLGAVSMLVAMFRYMIYPELYDWVEKRERKKDKARQTHE